MTQRSERRAEKPTGAHGAPAARMTEAERRAFNKGLETAAKLVDLWAEENIRMCNDTILSDPMLNGSVTRATLKDDVMASRVLQIQASGHSAVFHAGTKMAKMIREQKVKR